MTTGSEKVGLSLTCFIAEASHKNNGIIVVIVVIVIIVMVVIIRKFIVRLLHQEHRCITRVVTRVNKR